ncbi:MAG: glycosyltransferase family 2 protein [Lachnospiraceae bacterium]|nr:glycosyltransferase family 2 protein [Lachnospiraceae bacterium]
MKITVVTVCYQAENTIEETIQSVLAQEYQDMEYLIIDGKSTDRTMEIVRQYANDARVRVISEKDTGLYNAMNKGSREAQGDYIIFLNSGDIFADKNVLADMAPHLIKDIVFGNVVRRFKNREILEKYPGKQVVLWLLLQGKMMSHQVIFTKTTVMRRYGFDETYKITADYDFLVRVRRDKCSMQYVDRTVSIVENCEGISSVPANLEQMRKEDDRSLKRNFPGYYYLLKPVKYVARKRKRSQQ